MALMTMSAAIQYGRFSFWSTVLIQQSEGQALWRSQFHLMPVRIDELSGLEFLRLGRLEGTPIDHHPYSAEKECRNSETLIVDNAVHAAW
jgi:hypothetical protein